jgi:hypothetical protein
MDLEAFRWLLTPDGQALLATAVNRYDGPGTDPTSAPAPPATARRAR